MFFRIIGGRSSQGFLLLEAACSLCIILVLSTLLFSWHAQLVKSFALTSQTIQALYVARSLLEQVKAGKTPLYQKKLWQVVIDSSTDAILSIHYIAIAVSPRLLRQKRKLPLITLKTAYKL